MPLKTLPDDKNFTDEVKRAILEELDSFVESYRIQNNITTRWKKPLIGFAGANHPYVRSLKEIISPTHLMPEDVLEGATSVLCFFFPFEEETVRENIKGDTPSPLWATAYPETNTMFVQMANHIKSLIESWGYRAEQPSAIGKISEQQLYSNWSQRHFAYAAGLGTFGVNNMLIGEQGCTGRYFTLVCDLPVIPDEPQQVENCLYKREGKCLACVRRCPVGALSPEGFDREKCFARVKENSKQWGNTICGKCSVGMPCSFKRP